MRTRIECDRCFGRAIFIGADGSWRCVVCTPYKDEDED